uniref:WW domain-containing protein n=1 Tax=Panagrolaimus sp. JU765 TaxID=591449 RepID=A0AC34QCT1_9BILA
MKPVNAVDAQTAPTVAEQQSLNPPVAAPSNQSSANELTSLNNPNFQKYLKILDIDPEKDQDLLWIAREGFVQPLGGEWKTIPTDDGDFYFVHRTTGKSSWEHPSDAIYRQKVEFWKAKRGSSPEANGQGAKDVEVLSSLSEDVESSDSVTFGSPEVEELPLEAPPSDELEKLVVSSPRSENSNDERKKVSFSKHLVKIYEFNDGTLQWKRSNLFRKQNSADSDRPHESDDSGDDKGKQTPERRPGTPLIVQTERYRRLKRV